MSIELIVLDVDGTMTDSRITYSEEGDEIRSLIKRALGFDLGAKQEKGGE